MPIFLFTDFGASDLYVGQVRATLLAHAPRQTVIDLLHDAPAFAVRASAHLLAAMFVRIPVRSVVLAVVDPGVGGRREALAVRADNRWLVGPDNGLLSVAAQRAGTREMYRISWRPKHLSDSFHGRDLFAPVAGMLARGARQSAKLRKSEFSCDLGAGDLREVIYVDHFGNVITGIRADAVRRQRTLRLKGQTVAYARVFSEVRARQLFWYENSLGLVEIAANSASAQEILGVTVGDSIE